MSSQSEHDFLTKIAVAAGFVITWFLVTLAAELLGNQANETDIGQNVGRSLLIGGVVVVPLVAVVWAGIKLWKWRHPAPQEPGSPMDPPPPPEPTPEWHTPGPIHARDREVASVVATLLGTGVAVVSGARDVGTSAVAAAAVQSLIHTRRVDAKHVAYVDLRSRSSRTADDARATAGRLLSMFGQDEPANGLPTILANAATRLHDVLARNYTVLLLDNVTSPAEVAWLLPQWTERNPRQPWLVIAGETVIEPLVPSGSVRVDPLSTDGMRAIWYADTDTAPAPLPPAPRPTFPRRLLARLRPLPVPQAPPPSIPDPIDKLLAACRGRPRAIKAVARETTGSAAAVGTLLAKMDTEEKNPLVGVWRAILLRTEDSLSPEARWLLHALAVIPVTALAREAIVALVTAHSPEADPGPALPASFEELRVRDFVTEVRDRYRLPQEIRWAVTDRPDQQPGLRDDEVTQVAVPALIRHHADRVVRKANRLDVPSDGANAAKWLGDEEPTLRPLFTPDNYEDRGGVLSAVIDDLARIAGALEYWYVREQQADGLLTVSTDFRVLANLAERPGLAALAAARQATAYRMLGQAAKADEQLCLVEGEARLTTDHALGTELVTRVRVERALLGDAPDGARQALEELANQPRHPGAGIAMLNLGALLLAENALDEALPFLDRAEIMARDRQDTGCQAQAVELRGIALSGKDLRQAVSLWQEARQLFELIGEEQGQARCMQHLGAAALVDSSVADRLAEGVVRLLQQSKALRAGQPDTDLVDEYLRLSSATQSGQASRRG